MNARNYIKRPFDPRLYARFVLVAARLRLAPRVDSLVAHWLERCATNIEAAQGSFETDRKPPTPEAGMGVSFVVSSPRWEESP
jgi:hypothetical protein